MGQPADEIFEQFEIEFDAGPEPVFHGGELITGSLKVNLKQQITIHAIRLQFKGRSCWVSDSAKDGEVEKVYFDKDIVLLERPPGRPEPGHFPWNANFTYSLPFECPLPKGCPTSYESPKAFVRYYARATFQTEAEAAQYLVKKAFSIVAPPELHQLLPPASEPVTSKESIASGGCCCRGKITTEVALPKSSYGPGENVIGTFTVDNRHPRHVIDQIEVRLVDRVKKADPPSAENAPSTPSKPSVTHRVLFLRKLEKGDVIKSKSSVTRADVCFLTIPPVAPTTPSNSEAEQPALTQELISLAPDGQLSKLLESPSTATLKLRKQPFIRVDYALQVSLGTNVLVEVPITIHPIPIYATGIGFRPFAAGAMPIGESDESDKKPFHGPFTFEPRYPAYLEPPQFVDPLTSRQVTHETNAVPNGVAETTKTTEVTALPDGTKVTHTIEELTIVREFPEEEMVNSVAAVAAKREPPPLPPPRADNPKAAEPEEPKAESSNGQISNGHHEPVVVNHQERDEKLTNGHIHTVTEDLEDGHTKTHRTVEEIEYQDEDGTTIRMHKTTESTQITTAEIGAD